MNIIKRYEKSNKICSLCGKYVIPDDIIIGNYYYSETHLHRYLFCHKTCFKKLQKRGDKND